MQAVLDQFNSVVNSLKQHTENRTRIQKWLIAGGGLLVLVYLGKLLIRGRERRVSPLPKGGKPYQSVKSKDNKEENEYDVVVAGGGVSGSTCAFFLAKKGLQVLVLEKNSECNTNTVDDVLTMSAQKIISEMGVLKACQGNAINAVSINGHKAKASFKSVHDTTGSVYKNSMGVKASQVRSAVVESAKKQSNVTYLNNQNVLKTRWSPSDKLWTVDCEQSSYRARAIVLADGGQSELATKLRLVKTPTDGTRSHLLIKANQLSKAPSSDQVIAYHRAVSPGYCSIIKYSDGDVGLSTVVVPGNPRVSATNSEELHSMCKSTIGTELLGILPNDLEAPTVVPLRTGGVERTFKDHLLVVGGAAGLMDPLTGSSITYSLQSAKIAAEVIHEGFTCGDLTDRVTRRYQEKWRLQFNQAFQSSLRIRGLLAKYPTLVEAIITLAAKKGDSFSSELLRVFLGAKDRSWFLRPDVTFFFLIELARLSLF
ncbi:cmfB [Acrasis kona]|uniref:CmfB n=1 Tax=Acrasis kona TaxID=1008807 RepID=A0AAW2Z985_9EUKA